MLSRLYVFFFVRIKTSDLLHNVVHGNCHISEGSRRNVLAGMIFIEGKILYFLNSCGKWNSVGRYSIPRILSPKSLLKSVIAQMRKTPDNRL